jgi:precorrin-6B methylase 2
MMNFLLFVLIMLILITASYGAISAAPWLPTRRRDVKRMIDLADLKPGEVLYDLGCGDGRLTFEAARRGAKAVGIEVFILPYLYSWVISFFKKHVTILFGDLFNYNVSRANVVTIFLMDKSYKKLTKKLEQELKPGSRVVVSCWPIETWKDKLVKEDKPSDKDLPLFLYKI